MDAVFQRVIDFRGGLSHARKHNLRGVAPGAEHAKQFAPGDNIRARAWLSDPKNHEAVLKILAKVTKVSEETYRGWVFTEKDTYRSKDATFDSALLQKNIDDLHKEGVIPSTIDVARYADLSLVAEAKKRLGM